LDPHRSPVPRVRLDSRMHKPPGPPRRRRHSVGMRTFGVEEELLLVDEETGRPVPAAPQVLMAAMPVGTTGGCELIAEIQQEMLEVVTAPHTGTLDLATEVRQGRSAADRAARTAGVRAVAL